MAHNLDFGKRGEEIACEFLRKKNFVILEQNFRSGRGEIDLIAKQNETIIFIEVKTRSSEKFGYPEESVNESKKAKLKETAINYLEQRSLQNEIRFDIISITITKDKTDIYHIEDAFFH